MYHIKWHNKCHTPPPITIRPWHNKCHTPPSTTTRHMGELWYELCHFMWHKTYSKPICQQHSLLKHAYVRIWTLTHWLTKMICLFSFSICLQGNLTNIKRDNGKYPILYWPMNKVIRIDKKLISYLRMKISLLIRHVGMKHAWHIQILCARVLQVFAMQRGLVLGHF